MEKRFLEFCEKQCIDYNNIYTPERVMEVNHEK